MARKSAISHAKAPNEAEMAAAASASGLTVHCPGGSHHVVRSAAGAKISIPAHRPIKAIYIKKLIRLIQTGKGDNE